MSVIQITVNDEQALGALDSEETGAGTLENLALVTIMGMTDEADEALQEWYSDLASVVNDDILERLNEVANVLNGIQTIVRHALRGGDRVYKLQTALDEALDGQCDASTSR